jgi:hypothetical protein
LDDWITRNPIGCGINWTSALEVGLRLINFHWIDVLLHATGNDEIRANQERLAARILPGHVWWVWQHRSYGSSANNHLLGELAGLILTTRRWPSLMHLACCAEKTWQQLQAEVIRQFAPDGGNREQALHYHLFAWEMAWQAQRVMGRGSVEFEDRLNRAAFFFAALSHPEEPWEFGDSDDAEITPFDKAEIDEMIVEELRKFIELPDWRITRRWHGIYAKLSGVPAFVARPAEGVTLVTATGGSGMTMAFGLAERMWDGKM